jgi:hypothetical protein
VKKQFDVTWVLRAPGKATQPPNPRYPDGLDVDITVSPSVVNCVAELPYPATGLGVWMVSCRVCGYRVGVTAAGRVDDPRSVRMPCQPHRGTAP